MTSIVPVVPSGLGAFTVKDVSPTVPPASVISVPTTFSEAAFTSSEAFCLGLGVAPEPVPVPVEANMALFTGLIHATFPASTTRSSSEPATVPSPSASQPTCTEIFFLSGAVTKNAVSGVTFQALLKTAFVPLSSVAPVSEPSQIPLKPAMPIFAPVHSATAVSAKVPNCMLFLNSSIFFSAKARASERALFSPLLDISLVCNDITANNPTAITTVVISTSIRPMPLAVFKFEYFIMKPLN